MAGLDKQPVVIGSWFEQNQFIYRYPELVFARDAELVVQTGELAFVVGSGRRPVVLGTGRYRLDALDLPRVGAPDAPMAAGSAVRAELSFIATHALSAIKFGGPLADVVDPNSEQVVSLRVFGEFTTAVLDAGALVAAFGGGNPAGTITELRAWCSSMVFKALKVTVTKGIARGQWAVLELSAHALDIEALVVQHVDSVLGRYGLRIATLGYFDVTMAPQDAERLKQLALDVKYMRLRAALPRGSDIRAVHDPEPGMDVVPMEPVARTEPANRDRFCANCGSRLAPNARFCGMCGTPDS
ncbi:SPFH domain-containing protein [Nocardia colli]|uniref:SPFH domain-containing protein n=1 Tax=Nocardia colli TaxID=2545717 RepID=UPI0035E385FF